MRSGASMGPQFPVSLGNVAVQTDPTPSEDPNGFWFSSLGRKSWQRTYADPPTIPTPEGADNYGRYDS